MLCLVPAVSAALLLALLGRFTRRPSPIFLLVSLLPDWTVSMDSLVTRVLLSTLHLSAAALSVGVLLRSRSA